MALSPKLQVKQGQSLVMTPQLQQAIKLLQLSNIELSAFVEEQLESNPLLERGTGDENRRGEDVANVEAADPSVSVDAPASNASDMDAPDHAMNSEATASDIAADVGGSVDWSKAGTGGSFNGSGEYDAVANTAAEKSLSEHLHEQLAMLHLSDRDRLIARHLIDHVDENGYLRADITDIANNLGVAENSVLSLVTQLQTFEPTGVFARNLSECLSLQLRDAGALDMSMQALLDNLEVLAKHDLTKLMKLCAVDKEELMARVKRLKSLAPKPGLAYGGEMAAAVEPDVFIRETPQGGWAVELNSDTLPRVLVDNRYYNEIAALGGDEKTKEFMSECHANANWLVKSLDQRARTILKVASEIVKQQDGFFAYGIDHMRPLNLKTVADAIEMHESTVSRVTSNKFMSTPRGMFELKYFFGASIPSLGGGEAHSAEAVRHKIKILIDEEIAGDVKSDDKLVALLRDQGIDIARRTVAKYREALGIPSSVERRRIFKHSA
ncbi:RNA polymerase factor sigma-54 [Hellea balneolensis]|uniref:RNA polymerase factor sigma-54 n=1 Tax=Hellea balneolensis TaxID=287478 RepID=UPI00047E3137|nr:RNA polymerase factor sigma-54 [Hellea balneolensis]